jgi:hypothetical protein
MAISTALVVDSAASHETSMGDQSQASGNNEIVFDDTIVNNNNGDLVATPTYPERLVILRQGEADEETRYITSERAGTGTTMICEVHEDWTTQPSAGDSRYVSYICVDADSVGNAFKVLLKRESDWQMSNDFAVGNGTDFAYFALLDGHSWETDDGDATPTNGAIQVLNSGRLDVGYTFGGTAVAGGYTVSTAADVGDLAFDSQVGSEVNFSDFLCHVLN